MSDLPDLLKSWNRWNLLNNIEPVHFSRLAGSKIKLFVKRDDRLHHQVSGNKAYKLLGHIQTAIAAGKSELISFGGYYSNHLHALASVGQALDMPTYGFIRGHRPKQLSPTLIDCRKMGMDLTFLSRKEYLLKQNSEWLRALSSRFPDAYIVGEGGRGAPAFTGCALMMESIQRQMDMPNTTVAISCGTGTTLAGLLAASRPGDKLLGFPALKFADGGKTFRSDIQRTLQGHDVKAQWSLNNDFHFGGFAKATARLTEFMLAFENETKIPLDPVYTAKMVYGVCELVQRGHWPAGHQVLMVHSGGLQGRRGFAGIDGFSG